MKENLFTKKVKQYLHNQGIVEAGIPRQHVKIKRTGWFTKVFCGGGYQRPGIPDILACVNGVFLGLELKSTNGRATELQKRNIKHIQLGNGFAVILRPENFLQFKELISEILQMSNPHSGFLVDLEETINEKFL